MRLEIERPENVILEVLEKHGTPLGPREIQEAVKEQLKERYDRALVAYTLRRLLDKRELILTANWKLRRAETKRR